VSGYAFDANIIIDALAGYEPARMEIRRAAALRSRAWISRMVWIEVLSKGTDASLRDAVAFLSGFGIDELDEEIADRAASLRRERPRLKSADAIILATALVRGRVLVTRNVRDFPAAMPGIRVPYTF
jgi:predicted nucleic acid-binding protein